MEQAPKHRLTAAIWSPAGEEFVVVRQTPPPQPLPAEEYGAFADSELWDLPSSALGPFEVGGREMEMDGAESVAGKCDLSNLDLAAAVEQVLGQVGISGASGLKWRIMKYVEEGDFGPGAATNTVYVVTSLESKQEVLHESCMWISKEDASRLLTKVIKGSPRIGPHVVLALFPLSAKPSSFISNTKLHFQEYPPGLALLPMKSTTGPPFSTTTLVVVQAGKDDSRSVDSDTKSFICGDALIVDPGCRPEVYSDLSDIVVSLPRKLVVFVTHHHLDHINGLSVVQNCNPDAVLLAHTSTLDRIGKDKWSHVCISLTGGEKISIGDHQFEVIHAPGHTNGHLGLLHIGTNSLIVGDHCVGQGSAVLDGTSGGNMKDYFDTTYRFLGLAPHVIIPMHGRINLWPKQMLCGYLKHRKERESSILKIIENGARTLFDIVSICYADTDKIMWRIASQNVRLHVEYLELQQRLPKDFSVERFKQSFDEFYAKCDQIISTPRVQY